MTGLSRCIISHFFHLLFAVCFILHNTGAAQPITESDVQLGHPQPGITQELFDSLDMFMKYASSAYSLTCPSPLGNTLVSTINNEVTSTHAYIARDDTNKFLVVAFRGSQQITDFLLDLFMKLVPFESQGVVAPGARVHAGFLIAYNSVASEIIQIIQEQLAGAAAGYSLRTTGHSLGGSLSSIAAVSLKFNFPDVPIQMYTYGQPRTGNQGYATLVNEMFGDDSFRFIHTFDGVPTMIPQFLGYRHHAYEYWQYINPASPKTVIKCDASGEDPTCSDKYPSLGINLPHIFYFDRPSIASFCF